MSSGDNSGLVAAVVAALVRAASSAAGPSGTALGAEAIDWVRNGLGQQPQWAQAAARVDTAPDDKQAQQGLADAVNELFSLNPGLAQALESRLTPPGPTPTAVGEHAGPTAVGAGTNVAAWDVRMAIGKRGGIGALIAVLVVVAALIALGIHFVGHSSSRQAAKPLTNAQQVQAVLPDLAALPAGWQPTEPAQASHGGKCPGVTTSSGLIGDLCRQVVASAGNQFETAEPGGYASFGVVAGPSTSWADQMYDQYHQSFDDGLTNPVDFPAFGDRSFARRGSGETSIFIRTGTVIVSVVVYTARRDSQAVIPFAEMITTRAQQAQAGQTPAASAH